MRVIAQQCFFRRLQVDLSKTQTEQVVLEPSRVKSLRPSLPCLSRQHPQEDCLMKWEGFKQIDPNSWDGLWH